MCLEVVKWSPLPDDAPEYTAEQMHATIHEVASNIGQFSESPRCQDVSAEVVAAIVAKLRSKYIIGDVILYSKSDARELIKTIERLCCDWAGGT